MLRSKGNLFLIGLASLALVVGLYRSLPGHIQERPGITQRLFVTDRNGKMVRSYADGESYDWIRLEEVPQELVELLILAEDRNFYEHDGVDLVSLMRSSWVNLKTFKISTGASTISQQVYRMGHGIERSLFGKIKTILGAMKIESRYTKKEILENYLNTLPYGKRLVGVKRSGEVLFGKDIHLLNLPELATLAVLPRSPSRLSKRPQELLNRRNRLLENFEKLNKISKVDLELSKKVPLQFTHDESGWGNYHFVEALKNHPEFQHYISRDGRIETVLDLDLQREATEIVKSHLRELKHLNVGQGALVVLNNETGDVLAYVGSQDVTQSLGGHYDALKLRRQPGSALKPLTFALALQKGKSLSDVLPDIPSYYKTGLGQFLPRNYDQDFSGPRLMREALANSLNLPAVALADEVGVEELYSFYKAMGLTLPKDAYHYGVGITLGNIEITPFELALTYTAFARGGSRIKARFFKNEPVATIPTPLTEEASYLISDVLSDNVSRREEFGEQNPFDFPFSFSVKTGTSTDFRDNWVVGYNRDYTILVWVGNTDQRPMKKVSGITGAGPILRDVVKFLSKRSLMHQIAKVPTVESHSICALSGKAPGEHCPHTKSELFVKGTYAKEKCQWHQEVVVKDCRYPSHEEKVRVHVLPDAYQAWINERPEWSVDGQISEICPFEEKQYRALALKDGIKTIISKPLTGSIYALDPNLPRELQKLKLELNRFHHVKDVRWKKDGKDLQTGSSSFNWPMEKGLHHFEAEVKFDDGKVEATPPIEVRVL